MLVCPARAVLLLNAAQRREKGDRRSESERTSISIVDARGCEALSHRPTTALADIHETIGQNDDDKIALAIHPDHLGRGLIIHGVTKPVDEAVAETRAFNVTRGSAKAVELAIVAGTQDFVSHHGHG